MLSKELFMVKKYIKLSFVLLSIFLFPIPAFADGGIPVWVNTIQTVAATLGIRGLGRSISNFIITLICLGLIVYCETVFLKKRYFKDTNTSKILKIVFASNLCSTILGGLFLVCVFYLIAWGHFSLGYLLIGPLYGILEILPRNSIISSFTFIFILVFYNVFFCFFSYFIEFYITKKYLQDIYDKKVISKGILRANILSYLLSFFLMLPIYLMLHNIIRV